MLVTTLNLWPTSQMNGFLISLGGYISHNRCWVGVVGLVITAGFLEALGMAVQFAIDDLRFTIASFQCFDSLTLHPPAMAGMMLISSPSFNGVCLFFRKRMSSSFTYTLTKRRTSPFSSTNRSWMPG